MHIAQLEDQERADRTVIESEYSEFVSGVVGAVETASAREKQRMCEEADALRSQIAQLVARVAALEQQQQQHEQHCRFSVNVDDDEISQGVFVPADEQSPNSTTLPGIIKNANRDSSSRSPFGGGSVAAAAAAAADDTANCEWNCPLSLLDFNSEFLAVDEPGTVACSRAVSPKPRFVYHNPLAHELAVAYYAQYPIRASPSTSSRVDRAERAAMLAAHDPEWYAMVTNVRSRRHGRARR